MKIILILKKYRIKGKVNKYFKLKGFNFKVNSFDVHRMYSECLNDEDINKLKLFIEFALNKNIMININDKRKDGYSSLIRACDKDDMEMVKLIMEYATINNISLNINDHNRKKESSFLWSYINENIDMAKLLIDYANNNNITLEIDKQNVWGNYPLLFACSKNNMKMIQLLIDYAEQNKIVMNLNERNEDGYYPLAWACYNNNIDMVKLLYEYFDKYGQVLEMSKRGKNGWYPLLLAILKHKNIKLTEQLIEYATRKKITLDLNEKEMKSISEIPSEFIDLLVKYENTVIITFRDNSKLLKRMERRKVNKNIDSS